MPLLASDGRTFSESRDGCSPFPGSRTYKDKEVIMAYAILRFAKHKGGASKALSAHHERTKDFYISNPDIDRSELHPIC